MRYFFHVRRGAMLLPDPEGSEYPTSQEAHAEGLSVARELLGRQLIGNEAVDWSTVIEIYDFDGQLTAVIGFRQAAGLAADSDDAAAEIPSQ